MTVATRGLTVAILVIALTLLSYYLYTTMKPKAVTITTTGESTAPSVQADRRRILNKRGLNTRKLTPKIAF